MQKTARVLAAKQNEADLGAVSMRNHDPEPALKQVRNVPNGFDHHGKLIGDTLVLRILDERIAANGNDQSFHEGRGSRVESRVASAECEVCRV